MTVRRLLHAFVKCTGVLFVLSDMLCVALTMPSEDGDFQFSEEIQNKINTFKRDILNGLGYTRPPNVTHVTRSIEEKRRMIQEYRRYIDEERQLHRDQYGEDDDDDEDRKVQSKTFYSLEYKGGMPSAVPSEYWSGSQAVRLYFHTHLSHPTHDHTRELHVHSAKLKLYISDVRPENLRDQISVDYQIRLNAYQILSIKNSTSYTRTLLDSRLVPLTSSGFVNFEIAKAVQSWVNDKDSNLGIEITAESQDLNDVVTIDTTHRKKETSGVTKKNQLKTFPSVKLYVQEKDILKRVKRRSRRRNECRKGSGETRCCKYPIKISFREIGWDSWVIAPQEYHGYYCAGECPTNYKIANMFSGIKSMLHTIQPNKVPSPCCVATKLSPFMLLHYDSNGKYTFSEFPDLVVEQCRCG